MHIVEIGGTVGDYEGLSFVEAIREFGGRVGRENCLYVHVVYVPFIGTSKEFKSKPAQNALNDLRGFGIVPDAVIVRTDNPAPKAIAKKDITLWWRARARSADDAKRQKRLSDTEHHRRQRPDENTQRSRRRGAQT